MSKKPTEAQKQIAETFLGKRRIINNANYTMPKGEVNTQISKTVPDQSMSVRDMVERYQSGIPMGGAKVPIFNGDDALPDISNMDLAEAQLVTEAIADQLADIKARIEQAKTSAQAKAEIERVEKLVQQRLQEIQKEQKNGKTDTQE